MVGLGVVAKAASSIICALVFEIWLLLKSPQNVETAFATCFAVFWEAKMGCARAAEMAAFFVVSGRVFSWLSKLLAIITR